ncbi:MAG: aldose epimerase [Gammaproteobacteria bacterium (ex Lamellibrachia satsuma)]|nr:MAG: D-hexose-6-phosphate mutarotase [Gammaproteobacteria bacterium (ex Lamellibrachia satsuma)]RRS34446.1 MAG: aldose epimerase [Gammaproteobacteria bacterium (ex Lamellibrachia satsuma)]RRS35108.1 MAG: aldose epimerase [Gammaproteobacteria bacterium (ex Lamellibrachia satsuma)]
MSVDQLNSEYAIENQLKFVDGEGGFPFIEIDNGKATALISPYAGQVLSFCPAGESQDLLFLSDQAYYQDGKAIKGGIPICWPWFGSDPEGLGRPGHGFVRNRDWSVVSTDATSEGDTRVVLGLVDTEETKAIWPHAFRLNIEITVGNSLTVELVTRNTGEQTFTITQAFHTYFRIGDIARVKVLGLEGLDYLDKTDSGVEKTQAGEITISSEVDRIYMDAPDELVIDDEALSRRIHISSAGSRTAVVWNPWAEISRDMADLGDEDFQRLLCVETANAASETVELPPGSESRVLARYRVSS